MQFRLDEKNRKPPQARNVTTFFFCLALTYCVLQVCRLACMCLCVSLTPRWWAGVRKHVGDTLDFSQFLVFSCKPLLSAMWHLCASTPAICINSGAASPSKNTHMHSDCTVIVTSARAAKAALWLLIICSIKPLCFCSDPSFNSYVAGCHWPTYTGCQGGKLSRQQ